MKSITVYIYVTIINVAWMFIFSGVIASGHSLSYKNPDLFRILCIGGVCVATALLLIFYRQTRVVFRILLLLFLSAILFICVYLIGKLIAIGAETYVLNMPFYLVLLIILAYTIKLMVSIGRDIVKY
jgi:hypothetical protein